MANTTQPGKSAQDAAKSTMDKAKDAASNVADKARDMAGNVADKARDAADKAREYAQAAGDRAEHLTARAGSGLESLGHAVRDRMPQGGTMGSVADRAASGLENAGRYLQEEGLSGMADDLTDLIRRNPVPSLLVGIGIGFLLARAMRS